jgi:uncharacterized protein YkwD
VMKHVSTIAAALVFTAIIQHPSYCAQRADEKGIKLNQLEQRLVKAINSHRAKHRLAPLAVDPILTRVARRSAPHYSHFIDGKWCWHRTRQAGFPGWATDDIANGYLTPEEAVEGWATSHGHEMQMRGYFKMNGRWQNYRFNRIGVGISGRKYIAIFGRSDDSRVTR